MNLIDRQDLKHNVYYTGESQQANIARWNAEKELFEYIYNSEVKTVPYVNVNDMESDADVFIPLFEITLPRVSVMRTGVLEKI